MKKSLSFDDVLLSPQFTFSVSRADVDVQVDFLGQNIFPIISSNMDSVTGPAMAAAMNSYGALGALHRFQSIEDNVKQYLASPNNTIGSFGLGKTELERAEALAQAGCNTLLLDVAHGASMVAVKQIKTLRHFFDGNVIMGNFATAKTINDFKYYLGRPLVNAWKVGIGGGCFAAGTKVLMSDGSYKNIEEIQIHDRVINKEGKPVDVVGVKFSGYKKALKYKTNTFYKSTLATPDHQHWVGDLNTIQDIGDCSRSRVLDKPFKNGNSKYGWKRLDQTKNTLMLLPKTINFELPETFNIKLAEFVQSRRGRVGFKDFSTIVTPSYDLGYLFGTFLGDGCARIYRGQRANGHNNTTAETLWYYGKEEIDIATKTQQALLNVFGANSQILTKRNMVVVSCRNNFISRFFAQFGKKEKKHLPKVYMCSDAPYLKGIYEGLLDSDGSYGKDGRNSFCNTSSDLVELFMFLNYKLLGYYPSIQIKPGSAGGLVGVKDEDCKESYSCRTLNQPNNYLTKNYQIVPFSDPQEDLTVPTYDIEVDCETHSFIANNAIVHNSACETRVVTGVGLPTLASILDCSQVLEPIIADGGIRRSDDFCKALAAGATAVMVGGLLAGTKESAAEAVTSIESLSGGLALNTITHKKYRGSASKESYEAQGKIAPHRTSEGASFLVPYTGPVADTLQQLEAGLRSCLTYNGATNILELQERAEFVEITSHGATESGAHGKKHV